MLLNLLCGRTMKVKLTLVAVLTYETKCLDNSTPKETAEYEANSTPYRDIVEDNRAIVTVKGEVVK